VLINYVKRMLKLNSFKSKIPLPIRLFLGKALLFFIVWKLIYGVFFLDYFVLDTYLTNHVGKSSVFVLNNFGSSSEYSSILQRFSKEYSGETINTVASSIFKNKNRVLLIANACNGLELLVLYIGFIICMPSSILRKIKYLILGVIMLDVVNIFRCIGLIYLYEYFQIYFDFAHHYLFKIVVYSTTFLIWMYFSRKINLNDKPV